MARPTLLTEELIAKTKDYIESCNSGYAVSYKQTVNKDGELVDIPEVKYEVNLPTIEGLAYELGIHKDTIYTWRKGTSELELEFSDFIQDLLHKQAKQLVNNGLSGSYNPTIAKVLLTKHGYVDKVEQDITTGGERITMTPETLALTNEFEKKLKESL